MESNQYSKRTNNDDLHFYLTRNIKEFAKKSDYSESISINSHQHFSITIF